MAADVDPAHESEEQRSLNMVQPTMSEAHVTPATPMLLLALAPITPARNVPCPVRRFKIQIEEHAFCTHLAHSCEHWHQAELLKTTDSRRLHCSWKPWSLQGVGAAGMPAQEAWQYMDLPSCHFSQDNSC